MKQFTNYLVTETKDSFKSVKIQQSTRFFISKTKDKLYKVKARTEKEIVKLVKDYQKGSANIINTYVVSKKELTDSKYIFITQLGANYIYVIESLQSKKDFKKEWVSYSDVMVGRNITLFNEPIDPIEYEKIDYDFYIEEANKLINAIEKDKEIKKQIEKPKSLF